MSLTAYITKVRVEKSKKLLLEDGVSLAIISSSVVSRIRATSQRFLKKETGVSPKRFRNNYFGVTSRKSYDKQNKPDAIG
jgi:YesN/AraC family two-component response regulator